MADVLLSLLVNLEMLKSLRCLLVDGDLGDGVRMQSAHLSEVASPFFRNVLPHVQQLPWVSSETKRCSDKQKRTTDDNKFVEKLQA